MTSKEKPFDQNEALDLMVDAAVAVLNDRQEFLLQTLGRTPEALLRRATLLDFALTIPTQGGNETVPEYAAARVARDFMLQVAAIKATDSLKSS